MENWKNTLEEFPTTLENKLLALVVEEAGRTKVGPSCVSYNRKYVTSGYFTKTKEGTLWKFFNANLKPKEVLCKANPSKNDDGSTIFESWQPMPLAATHAEFDRVK